MRVPKLFSPRQASDVYVACVILGLMAFGVLSAPMVLSGQRGFLGAGAGIAIALTTPWTANLLFKVGSLAITAEIAHKFALHSRQIDRNTLKSLEDGFNAGRGTKAEYQQTKAFLEAGLRRWDTKVNQRSDWLSDLKKAGQALVFTQSAIIGLASAVWGLAEFIERILLNPAS